MNILFLLFIVALTMYCIGKNDGKEAEEKRIEYMTKVLKGDRDEDNR